MASMSLIPGSIRGSPDGRLIVIMRDDQATGGCSRPFHVPEPHRLHPDLPAQIKGGTPSGSTD